MSPRRRDQLSVMRDLLQKLRQGRASASVVERRDAWNAQAAAAPTPQEVGVELVALGGVACEQLTPLSGGGDLRLLYLHGGGFVSGSPATHRAGVARLASALGAVAILPDYRLAPEHPFPAAPDDVLAVYRALLSREGDADRFVVVGDSAGGGLALSLALDLAALGLPQPRALAVLAPWTDLTLTAASLTQLAEADFVLTLDSLSESAALYARDADRRDPRLSPLFADLSNLPPLLIQAGGADILLDDAVALARRAGVAGVETTLEIYPEMPHGWFGFAGLVDEAAWSGERLVAWLAEKSR